MSLVGRDLRRKICCFIILAILILIFVLAVPFFGMKLLSKAVMKVTFLD